MNRRQFLGAAAALSTLPVQDVGADIDAPDTLACDACGAEKPAEFVDHTTVPDIAPLEVDICRSCQFTQQHTPAPGTCAECGDAVDAGFSIELEYPLGPADLPARKVATLCGDCAAWIACDINHRGVQNDEPARERLHAVIEAETARMNALEGGDE